jgi:hypothetical protein
MLEPTKISRRRAAKINLILGYGRYTVGIFNQLILVPLYLRFIGIAAYGSWLASGNVVTLFSVLDIGFNLHWALFWLAVFSSAQSRLSCRHGFPDGLTRPQARLQHCVEQSC